MHDANNSRTPSPTAFPDAIDFFRAWDTYAKVVAANYMFHRELGQGVREALRRRFDGRAFSLLDLGCGDATALSPLLEGLQIKSYKGVDLAPPALALAAKTLARLGCPIELVEADFMSALRDSAPQDAIYSSFAQHHLTTDGKAEFFALAAKRLNPGGLLILVDVTRAEDECHDDYMRNYTGWLRKTMTGLATQELDQICDHLTKNDIPETAATLRAQAERAGLVALNGLVPHKWHRLLLFAPA
ncbi:MAG TPA: class I SAM-dependent methyltransferase [Methylocystis sp.]|nr:class I SAM-dependent methyltransferase [Methylocystis sp.]